MENKRGQLTIFIIIAILIVSIILIFFLWVKPNYSIFQSSGLNFEKCVEDAVIQDAEKLALTAGYLKPESYYTYKDNQYQYLCYTDKPYITCTVQKALVKQNFEKNLLLSAKDKINACYSNSINELKSQGLDVVQGNLAINLSINMNAIDVVIKAPTTIGGQQFTTFKRTINSPLYDMLILATSILQYETTYGDSSTTDLMIAYPDLIITKLVQDDSTKLYTIEHKSSKIKLLFAVRGIIWPEGYGLV